MPVDASILSLGVLYYSVSSNLEGEVAKLWRILWLLTIRRDILFFIISRFHCTLQEQHKAGSSSPKSYHISPCGEHCGCGADCFIKRLNNTMASEQSSTVGKSLHDIPLTSRVAWQYYFGALGMLYILAINQFVSCLWWVWIVAAEMWSDGW